MSAIITSEQLGLYTRNNAPTGDPRLGRFGNDIYVNSVNGNLVVQETDEYLASLGINMGVVRTYNSQGQFDGDNNDNWRLNVYRELLDIPASSNTAGSVISKRFGDGAEQQYTYDQASGLYISTAGDGAHDTLRFDGSVWLWTDGTSAATETYNTTGQLLSVSDSDGNSISYTYSGNLISQISDTSGQSIYLDYDINNNLTQIGTVSGGQTQIRVYYAYDAQNRLAQVQLDLTPDDQSITDGEVYTTTYNYESSSTRIASITNTDGTTVSFGYELAGSDWKIKTVTDGEGKVTNYTYLSGQTDVTDALGRVSSYRYDTEGRLTEVLGPPLASGQRLSTVYSYDADDNLVSITDARDFTLGNTYDDKGNLLSRRDALGNTIRYTYTDKNQLATETLYRIPDPDGDGPETESEPLTTRYIYDSEDHLRFTIDAQGQVTEQRYNTAGSMVAAILYTADVYDLSGPGIDTVPSESLLAAWANDPARQLDQLQLSEYSYDFRGQLAQRTTFTHTNATTGAGVADGTESRTYFIYDQHGRLIKTVDPRGAAPVDANWQAGNFETHYTYDGLDRLLQTIDALGNVTQTNYDDANNRSITTQANGLLQTSVYDRNGRLLDFIEADSSAPQPLGETLYFHDAAGQLCAIQDPIGAVTHRFYDAAGRLSATLDETGALIENSYNENGQLIQETAYAERVDGTLFAQLLLRDSNGVATSINTALTLNDIRPQATENDRNHYNIHDEAGRLAFEIDAEGFVTEYRYDGSGVLNDTIRHDVAFPGFYNDELSDTRFSIENQNARLEWLNLAFPVNGSVQILLENLERLNGMDADALRLDLDLANNTGTATHLKQPEQPFDFDTLARTDSRTIVDEMITVASTHSPVTLPQTPSIASGRIDVSSTSGTWSISRDERVDYAGSITILADGNVSANYNKPSPPPDGQSGPPDGGGGGQQGPTNWVKYFESASLYSIASGSYVTNFFISGDLNTVTLDDAALGAGDYLLEVTWRFQYGNLYEFSSSNTSFTFTKTNSIGIPVISGAQDIAFFYRPQGTTTFTELTTPAGNAYQYVPDAPENGFFRIRLPITFSGNYEFKASYLDAGGSPLSIALGTFQTQPLNSNGNVDYIRYTANSNNNGLNLTRMLGDGETYLNGQRIGILGDNAGNSIYKIEVRAVSLQTGTAYTATSHPQVVNELFSISGEDINFPVVPDGKYRLEFTTYSRSGLFSGEAVSHSWQIDEYQVGPYNQQRLTWPLSAYSMNSGDSATFWYRKQGNTDFRQMNFQYNVPDITGRNYFSLENGEYVAQLFNLEDNANYEFKIEYRDNSGRLISWSGFDDVGDANGNTASNIFNANAGSTQSQNLSLAFRHPNDQSIVAENNAQGLRIPGYLQANAIEWHTIDHMRVNVLDLNSNNYVQQDVYTLPHVTPNYDGELNVTRDLPLTDGRYQIEVTIVDKQGNTALRNFMHEVGLQPLDSESAVFVNNAGVLSFASSGNLQLANSLSAAIDGANETLSLALDTLLENPYHYSITVSDANGLPVTQRTGTFAAYAGNAPDINILRDYYQRDHRVAVEVINKTIDEFRPAAQPIGYSLLMGANTTATAQTITNETFSVKVSNSVTTAQNISNNVVSLGGPATSSSALIEFLDLVPYIYNANSGQLMFAETYNGFTGMSPNPGMVPNSGEASAGNINVSQASTLPPGDYYVRYQTVSRRTNTNPKIEALYGTVYYYELSGISVSSHSFRVGGQSLDTSVTWNSATQPAGTRIVFKYKLPYEASYRTVSGIQNLSNGNFSVSLGTDVIGGYDYIIEYIDNNSNTTVKQSVGRIEVGLGQQNKPAVAETVYEWIEFPQITNGTSLVSVALETLAANQSFTAIQIRINGGTPVYTTVSDFGGNYRGEVNLTLDAPLKNGIYNISLTLLNNGVEVNDLLPVEMRDFSLEMGPQTETSPATEIKWSAAERPANSEVYFRYKPIYESEFAPQNMWIRATAAQNATGDYFVRFPQVTPDGQRLEQLPEGQYDYKVIYLDRDSGEEIEGAAGRFRVVHSMAGEIQSCSDDILFTRDLEGRHTRNFYDAANRKLAELDAEGFLTEYQYNSIGQRIETIHYANETQVLFQKGGTLDQLRPVADAQDIHEYFFYDGQGRLTGELDGEGYLTEHRYDAVGNEIAQIHYYNKANAYTSVETLTGLIPALHANDQVISRTYTSRNQLETETVHNNISEYQYDSVGHLMRTTAALGAVEQRSSNTRYDLQGNIIQSLTGEGDAALQMLLASNPSATQAEIDAIWTQYGVAHAYDAAGQVKTSYDQNNNITRYYYDASGRIRFSINAEGNVQERIYNAFGQVTQTIAYANSLDNITLSGLNGGLLTSGVLTVFNALRDAEQDSATQQDYDTRGLLRSDTDALGYTTDYRYDGFGQLQFERETLQGGRLNGEEFEREYIYDKRGLLTNILDDTTGIQHNQGFDYDAFGRQIAEYRYSNVDVGDTREHYFSRYDKNSRVTQRLEVHDFSIPGNEITRSVGTFQYDAFNRILSQTDANGHVSTYSYDDQNRAMTITTPEGLAVTSRYNRHGEEVSVSTTDTTAEYLKNRIVTGSHVLSDNTSNQFRAPGKFATAALAGGNYMVVWSDYDDVLGYQARRIYAQIMTANGTPAGQRFRIDNANSGDVVNSLPDILEQENGELLVSWWEYDANLQQKIIKAQRYDATGQVLTSNYQLTADVAAFLDVNTNRHRLTSLGNGHILLTAVQSDAQGVSSLIGQIYDANGQKVGAQFSQSVSNNWENNNITVLANGDFVVSTLYIETYPNNQYAYRLKNQRYNAEGQTVTPALVRYFATNASIDSPLVTGLADGGYVMGWLEIDTAGISHIKAQRVNANNQVVGAVFTVSDQNTTPLGAASLMSLQEGGFIFSWSRYVNNADHHFVQLFDASGNKQGGAFEINSYSGYGLEPAELIELSNGNIAASWFASELEVVGDLATAVIQTEYQSLSEIQYEYDKNGNLIRSIDGEGHEINHEYDHANRLTVTTDAEGYQVVNSYDAANRVIERTLDPNGLNQQTQYRYDSLGRIIKTTDPEGTVTETHYDQNGQVTAVIVDPAPTEDDGLPHLNLVTTYRYDGRGQQLAVNVGGEPGMITRSDGTQEYQKALNSTVYEYDIHGRLIQEIIDPTITLESGTIIEGLNIVTTYAYDSIGNRTAATDANGNTTRYAYDKFGRLTYIVNALGEVSENRYDAAGNLIATQRYANTINPGELTEISPAAIAGLLTPDTTQDRLAQKIYDGDNRLRYSINAAGIVTEMQYDSLGNIAQQTVYSQTLPLLDNQQSSIFYTDISAVQSALQSQTDGLAEQNSWSVYDANGRALYNIDSLGYVTENTYDGNGHLLKSLAYAKPIATALLADPNTARTAVAAGRQTSTQDRLTRFAYDAAGRQAFKIDAGGYLTETRYDNAGRVTESLRYATAVSGLGDTPALNTLQTLATQIQHQDDRQTINDYDAAGRLMSVTDAEGKTERYEYDAAGNRIKLINKQNNVWQYDFDAANRMIAERSPEVAVTRLDAVIFQEDFAANTSLGANYIGEITSAGATHVLNDGRLTLKNNAQSTDIPVGLIRSASYAFINHRRFETTFTTGADTQAIQMAIAAGNNQASSAGRYHTLYINNGVMLSAYYDGTDTVYVPVTGVSLDANQTYIVEIGSETETDINGVETAYSLLYVYQQGQSRSEAFVDRRQTDWPDLQQSAEARQTLTLAFTSKANQTETHAIHIDRMRELLPYEQRAWADDTLLSEYTGMESIVTRFEYNAMGDVVKRIEAASTPDERISYYSYDALNRQMITRFPAVNVYSYSTDAAIDPNNPGEPAADAFRSGRAAEVWVNDLRNIVYFDAFGNAAAQLDVNNHLSFKVYDAANRLVYDIDANGYVTENNYDAFGNIISLTRYAQSVSNQLPVATNSSETWILTRGQVQSWLNSADPQNRTLQTNYDSRNRAIRSIQPEATAGSLDNNGDVQLASYAQTSEYHYNAFGELIQQSALGNNGESQNSYLYYDKNGRRIASVDAENYITIWEYDSAGNISREIQYAQAIQLPTDPLNFTAVQAAIQSRSLSMRDPIQPYALQSSTEAAAYLADYIAASDISRIDTIAARVFMAGSNNPIGQTVLTVPADISNYNGEVYLSKNIPLADGQYDIEITIYYNDGSVPLTTVNANQAAMRDTADNSNTYSLNNNVVLTTEYTAGSLTPAQAIPGSDTTQALSNLQVATHASGNSIAIWEQNTGTWQDLYYSEYDETTGLWSAATEFYSGNHNSIQAQVLYDQAGNITVAWYQGYELYVKRYDQTQGQWQSAISLGGIKHDYGAEISADAQGNIIALWRPSPGSIKAARYNMNTHTWTNQLLANESGRQFTNFALAQNDAGQAIAVWQKDNNGQFGVKVDYYYATYDLVSGWQTAQTFLTDQYFTSMPIDLAFNNQGDAMLVWSLNNANTDRINAIRYSNGSWESAFALEQNTGWLDDSPEVHLDEQGNAIAIWENDHIKSRVFDINNGWGELTVLSSESSTGRHYPRLSGTAEGYTVATWKQGNDILTARYIAGEGWHAAESMQSNASLEGMAIAVNTDNTAQLAWIELENGHYTINSSQTHYTLNDVQPYYIVQAGDSWASIATQLYGTASVADALRLATGNERRTLLPGLKLSNLPTTLNAQSIHQVKLAAVQIPLQAVNAAQTVSSAGNTQALSNVQIASDALGNSIALWEQNTGNYRDLYFSLYDANRAEWSAAAEFYRGNNDSVMPQAVYDEAGNITVAWYQGYELMTRRYDHLANAWQNTVNLGGSSREETPALSSDAFGNTLLVWKNTGMNRLNIARFNTITGTWKTESLLDDSSIEIGHYTIAQNAQGQAMLIWDQRVDNGGTIHRNQYYRLYTNGNWQATQSIQTGLYDYSMPMDLAYNAQGDAILIWVEQGGSNSRISAIRYSGGAWGTAFDLDTNITWIDSKAEVHLDAQGNANVLWENNQIKTRRYDINHGWSDSVILSSNINTGNQLQHIAGNADGHTVAVWKENGNLYTARYLPGSGWKPVQQIGTNGALVTDSAINIDDFGHAKFAWIADTDANGINDQLASTHLALGMPLYTVTAGDTWESIAQTVYGNNALAAELRAALAYPELSAGLILELPMQLIETGIDLAIPYIEIQGNETWESIAQAVYSDAAAASALRAILGDPPLLPGLRLQLPANLGFAAQTTSLQSYEIGRQLDNNGVDNSSGIGYDRETVYQYDGLNRLTASTRIGVMVNNATVTAQHHAEFTQAVRNLTTAYTYDAIGNVIQETDADGNIMQRSYDVMGRMTSETEVTRKQSIAGLADIHAALIVKEPGSSSTRLEWAKPAIPQLQTTLELTANGITTTFTVTDNGTSLSADVATLASGQYHYRIIYRRDGESVDYAQASGDINLMTANASAAANLAWRVLDNGDHIEFSGALTGIDINGTTYNADANHRVDLSSLVRGNYTFSTVGASINLSGDIQKLSGALGGAFAIQTLDTRLHIKIQEQRNYRFDVGPVRDASRWHGQNQLHITLPDFSQMGTGLLSYSLDLEFSNHYGQTERRTVTGTSSGGTLLLADSISEHAEGAGAYSRLERLVHITVWKQLDSGQSRLINTELHGDESYGDRYRNPGNHVPRERVLAIDTHGPIANSQQLEFINLPSDTQTAVFAYRRAGSDDAYLYKTLEKAGNGYFTLGNRDIPPGRYEYQIKLNGSNTVANFTGSSGTTTLGADITLNTSIGIATVNNLATEPAVITPLTVYRYDLFGNAVQQIRYANNVDAGTQIRLNADSRRDQTIYSQYNTHGHLSQQINPEGQSTYYSYDRAGRIAKQWRWLDDATAPGGRRMSGSVTLYDAVGQPITSHELTESHTLDTHAVMSRSATLRSTDMHYNAFGEMTQRGIRQMLRGDGSGQMGEQEYFDYDNAGHLWRSNGEDGIARRYLYDHYGRLLQHIRSATTDLRNADTSILGNPDLQKTTYLYDHLGRAIEQHLPTWQQANQTYTPVLYQQYDRWGNVIQTTDATGTVTQYRYNHDNKLIEKTDAALNGVAVTDQYGVTRLETPTTHYYFDALGRALGERDANLNTRVQTYNAAGEQIYRVAGDGGQTWQRYDRFGREIERSQQVDASRNVTTLKNYNRNNQLISEYASGDIETHYTYDSLGNRKQIRRLENRDGNLSTYQTTDYRYDIHGNLIEEQLNGTRKHRYHYDLNNHKTLEYGEDYNLDNNTPRTLNWTYDYFGTLIGHQDLSGTDDHYTYNHNRQLTDQNNGHGQNIHYQYYNNGLLQQHQDLATGLIEDYRYDIAGRQTRLASSGSVDAVNDYTYDALGRLKTVKAASLSMDHADPDGDGPGSAYYADLTYHYDALGNRRAVTGKEGLTHDYSTTPEADPADKRPPQTVFIQGQTGANEVKLWYTYDAENRLIISQGQLENGVINRSNRGLTLQHDFMGNRTAIIRNDQGAGEHYHYDNANRLIQTTRGEDGHLTSTRQYDLLGREIQYIRYGDQGAALEYRYSYYNDQNQLAQQTTWNVGNNGEVGTQKRNDVHYRYDPAGNIRHTLSFTPGIGTTNYSYTYTYTDETLIDEINAINNSGHYLPGSSHHHYDANGHLIAVTDLGQTSNNRSYILNAQGQILEKAQDGKYQYYYYANGIGIGSNGELAGQTQSGRYHKSDFDFNYTPVSDQYPALTPGQYLVRPGDTLETAALAVYGDAQLWYLLADANGLRGNESLSPGQILTIPNNVKSLRNAQGAFKPYNASNLIGNTAPQLPLAPPSAQANHSDNCAQVIQIVTIIVAVIVAAYGYPDAAKTVLKVGNYIAMGYQVAEGQATLTDLAPSIIANELVFGDSGSPAEAVTRTAEEAFGNYMWKSIGSAALSQGISIAIGQQQGFNWRQLAASGINSAVAYGINNQLGEDTHRAIAGGLFQTAFSEGVNRNITGEKRDRTSVWLDAFGNIAGNYIAQKEASSRPMERSAASSSSQQQTPVAPNSEQAHPKPAMLDTTQQQTQTGGLNISSDSQYNEALGMDEITVTASRPSPVYVDDDLMLAQRTLALANRTLSNALRAEAFNQGLANKLANNDARLRAIHDSVPQLTSTDILSDYLRAEADREFNAKLPVWQNVPERAWYQEFLLDPVGQEYASLKSIFTGDREVVNPSNGYFLTGREIFEGRLFGFMNVATLGMAGRTTQGSRLLQHLGNKLDNAVAYLGEQIAYAGTAAKELLGRGVPASVRNAIGELLDAPIPSGRLALQGGWVKLSVSSGTNLIQTKANRELALLPLQTADDIVMESTELLAKVRGEKIVQLGDDLSLLGKGEKLSIVAHGSPTSMAGQSGSEIADLIKNSGFIGKEIELLSCNTGCGIAQDIVNNLGKGYSVKAPTGFVNVIGVTPGFPHVRPIGSKSYLPAGEGFKVFKPENSGWFQGFVDEIITGIKR